MPSTTSFDFTLRSLSCLIAPFGLSSAPSTALKTAFSPPAIIPCIIFWNSINLSSLLLIFLAAICGTIAQMLTIWGLKNSATTVVMPADYSRLIFAGVYGFIIFNELPYLNEIIGSIVIIVATMIILLLDQIKKKY